MPFLVVRGIGKMTKASAIAKAFVIVVDLAIQFSKRFLFDLQLISNFPLMNIT